MDLVISTLPCVLQSDPVGVCPPGQSSACALVTFGSWVILLCGAALLLLLPNASKNHAKSHVRKKLSR